jgi:hypothetical protein
MLCYIISQAGFGPQTSWKFINRNVRRPQHQRQRGRLRRRQVLPRISRRRLGSTPAHAPRKKYGCHHHSRHWPTPSHWRSQARLWNLVFTLSLYRACNGCRHLTLMSYGDGKSLPRTLTGILPNWGPCYLSVSLSLPDKAKRQISSPKFS